LEWLVSRIKGRPYAIDPAFPTASLLAVSLRRFVWLLRGCAKSLLFRRKFAMAFIAPDVNWRNANMIKLGRGVTMDRGVIVDGLSRRGVEISDNVMIGPYCVIRASGVGNVGEGLRIGANSALDAYSFIGAGGGVSIGKSVIMGQHVSFHAENHNFDRLDLPIREQGITRKGIVVEDDCWVGSNATFLDGAHVGQGCVIAAGAVVMGHIPPYSVVAGVPGRVVKTRQSVEKPAGVST
jgi:acetyltransferase-like isoleucine patch superfamily enzyme